MRCGSLGKNVSFVDWNVLGRQQEPASQEGEGEGEGECGPSRSVFKRVGANFGSFVQIPRKKGENSGLGLLVGIQNAWSRSARDSSYRCKMYKTRKTCTKLSQKRSPMLAWALLWGDSCCVSGRALCEGRCDDRRHLRCSCERDVSSCWRASVRAPLSSMRRGPDPSLPR